MKMRPADTRAFLIGKRGAGALPHRGESRLEACRAHDSRHHPICRAACGIDQRICAGRGLDAGAGKPGAEVGVTTLIGDDGKLRPVLHGEFGETRGVRPPVNATTVYDDGSRPTRSRVFSPIEPVAPSTEMRRRCVPGDVSLTASE